MTPQPTAPPRVGVAATGADAELFQKLRISSSNPTPKVVMRLGQGGEPHASLPDLHPGDRLLVSAELQVTTDCSTQHEGCAGAPYRYAPNVAATLLVAKRDSTATAGPRKGFALDVVTRRCKHERHHEVLAFDNLEFVVPDGGLPWSGSSWVNVALAAAHRRATRGHHLLIGQNEPDGSVQGDMGGISVVRLRPPDQTTPAPLRTTERRALTVPVVVGQKAVVYSQRLDALERGEQLAVRANVNTSSAHLGYPVRVKTEVVLSTSATDPDPGAEARRVTPAGPRICRGNGHNCLPAATADASPKVGAIRIVRNAGAPLYVNVVLTVGDPLRRAAPGQALNVVEAGFLEVVRYPAALAG
jgi:hypothetical protein